MEGRSDREKTIIYGSVAGALVVAAVAFVLLVPHSGGLAGCRAIALQGNRYSCLYSLAVSSGNASACSYIQGGGADDCYMQVALQTMNPSTCNSLSSYNYTYDCVSEIANRSDSYATCGYLNGTSRDSCIIQLALKLDNASACSSVSAGFESQVCSSAVYFAEAKAGGNATYCGMVYNTTNQTEASAVISLAEQRNIGLANFSLGFSPLADIQSPEGIPYNYSLRDICYLTVAYGATDNSTCGLISNSSLKGLCDSYFYSGPAPELNASPATIDSVCSGYSGANLSTCESVLRISVAISTVNASVCSQISNTSFEYQCYLGLARETNETSYCGYIDNASADAACVQDINYNVT